MIKLYIYKIIYNKSNKQINAQKKYLKRIWLLKKEIYLPQLEYL